MLVYPFIFIPEEGASINPKNTIVVKNNKPQSWPGRVFDVGVYKSGNLLVTENAVRIGDQVDFMLQPKLYFAVSRNMKVGQTFTIEEITSVMTMFDLSDYPEGLLVTLTQEKMGGEYSFAGSEMA